MSPARTPRPNTPPQQPPQPQQPEPAMPGKPTSPRAEPQTEAERDARRKRPQQDGSGGLPGAGDTDVERPTSGSGSTPRRGAGVESSGPHGP
jgi:hypothetical protein